MPSCVFNFYREITGGQVSQSLMDDEAFSVDADIFDDASDVTVDIVRSLVMNNGKAEVGGFETDVSGDIVRVMLAEEMDGADELESEDHTDETQAAGAIIVSTSALALGRGRRAATKSKKYGGAEWEQH